MSETEESKPQEYEMKETKIAVYLNQRKDFAWVPAAQTGGGSEEKVRTILDARATTWHKNSARAEYMELIRWHSVNKHPQTMPRQRLLAYN